jgi:ERCC4-type nuclease
VSGVGARRLLDHFGTVRAIAAAGTDELRQVPGIGPKRSAAIVRVMTHPWRRAEQGEPGAGG